MKPVDIDAIFARSVWCSETGHGTGGSSGTRKDGKERKRNAFAQPCSSCGRPLEPGQGVNERRESDGSWHAYCLAGLSKRPPDQRT